MPPADPCLRDLGKREIDMAEVKIEDIVYHLDREFKQALQDAISEHIPSADYDPNALFSTFQRAVYRRCSVWERVPDHLVRS